MRKRRETDFSTTMRCPFCGKGTEVIDSRVEKEERQTISRRRQCEGGEHRFSTVEFAPGFVKIEDAAPQSLLYRLARRMAVEIIIKLGAEMKQDLG